jgi:ubiquinone/menaquinone biosynthesis C-methylase UbiE
VKKTQEDKLAATVTKVIGSSPSENALGYSDAEHERLIRQAALIAPITKRLVREAGIGSGQRVFELGSGMGDVAMLVARLLDTQFIAGSGRGLGGRYAQARVIHGAIS